MSDPLVIVIEDREKTPGADSADFKGLRQFKAVPFSEAVATTYPYYAHFSRYQMPGRQKWPRLNKPALATLAPDAVTVELTVLDWDTEGHVPLELPGYLEIRQEVLDNAPPELPPTLLYKTRAGLRAVWQHPPLSPAQAEAFSRHLLAHYLQQGTTFDAPRSWPWNWWYALPFVRRDGRDLDPRPFHVGQELDGDSLPSLEADQALFLDHALLRQPCPDRDEAMSLVWRPGSSKLTPWGVRALKQMRGRDASAFFDYTHPPVTPQKRNPTLWKWICSTVSMCYALDGTTPQHVWGAALPASLLWNRQDGRDLASEAWAMTCRAWALESANETLTQAKTQTFIQSLHDGIRQWQDPPPDDQALRRKVILAHHADYYVLQASGLYAPTPVKAQSLIASLRHSGLVGRDRLLPALEINTPKGPAALSPQKAIDVFGMPVSTVEITGGRPVGGYLQSDGTLIVSRYARRTDIKAEFSPHVGDWLGAAFGPIHTPTFYLWAACVLATERGPCVALSVAGPPGIGKGMIAQGLAECFTHQTYADEKIFETWQYFIDQTPIVWIDENPVMVKGYDGAFRRLVGGTWITINQKHQAITRMQSNLRFLFTANSDALVRRLYSRRGMTREERAATAARIVHIDLTGRPQGAEHLCQKGNYTYTDGWVGRQGVPSRFEVARHLLWIYENTKIPGTHRFQIPATPTPQYEWEDPDVAETGETLALMLQRNVITDGTVSVKEVLDFMDTFLEIPTSQRPNAIQIGRRLSYWCGDTATRRGRRRVDAARLEEFIRTAGLLPRTRAGQTP